MIENCLAFRKLVINSYSQLLFQLVIQDVTHRYVIGFTQHTCHPFCYAPLCVIIIPDSISGCSFYTRIDVEK